MREVLLCETNCRFLGRKSCEEVQRNAERFYFSFYFNFALRPVVRNLSKLCRQISRWKIELIVVICVFVIIFSIIFFLHISYRIHIYNFYKAITFFSRKKLKAYYWWVAIVSCSFFYLYSGGKLVKKSKIWFWEETGSCFEHAWSNDFVSIFVMNIA